LSALKSIRNYEKKNNAWNISFVDEVPAHYIEDYRILSILALKAF
jgi:hypothetical protein